MIVVIRIIVLTQNDIRDLDKSPTYIFQISKRHHHLRAIQRSCAYNWSKFRNICQLFVLVEGKKLYGYIESHFKILTYFYIG